MNSNEETIREVKKLLNVPQNEPIFILRAQDDATPATMSDYLQNVKDNGASDQFRKGVVDCIMDFAKWRSENEDKCKTPD